jgi:hypothetical protein
MKKNLQTLDPDVDLNKHTTNINHDEIINILLNNSLKMTELITDLDIKLLVNRTKKPFISSDFPVVKYNQFLEKSKWKLSKTGYGTVGLQIIIPLNFELAIILFDSSIYKVGDKKKNYLDITNELDIDKLNILQFINCYETVFFDEKANEHYIRKLANDSSKYERANVPRNTMNYLIKDGEDEKEILNGKKNLMVFGSSDCECNLQITGMKINSHGKNYKFNDLAFQERKHSKKLRNLKNYH